MDNMLTRMDNLLIMDDGQMGRMLVQAAQRAGFRAIVWSPDRSSPAAQVTNEVIHRPFEVGPFSGDTAALIKSARGVLCGFENVPAQLIEDIEACGVPVYSLPNLLAIAQSRQAEKRLAAMLGIPTVDWCVGVKEGTSALKFDDLQIGLFPAVLKTDKFGYDGKGQWRVRNVAGLSQLPKLPEKMQYFVLEKQVNLKYECSVMVVRNAAGEIRLSRAVRNVHRNGILHHSFWFDGCVDRTVEAHTQHMAESIAMHFDLVGLLCCEFFVTKDGLVLFNELAPRPHNSFHGTIDACDFSQFDLYVQAVAGEVLQTMQFKDPWAMVNLLGEAICTQREPLSEMGFTWHDYGKPEARPGRKMGHATRLSSKSEIAAIIEVIQDV